MSVVEVLLFFLAMVLGCIIMWGFLQNARQELKKAKWIPSKRRLPQVKLSNVLGKKKTVDVLVCRTDGAIMISSFDYASRKFSIADVEAWRPLPLGYKASIRQMLGIFGKIKKLGKGN